MYPACLHLPRMLPLPLHRILAANRITAYAALQSCCSHLVAESRRCGPDDIWLHSDGVHNLTNHFELGGSKFP
jgi:hypothetical protein